MYIFTNLEDRIMSKSGKTGSQILADAGDSLKSGSMSGLSSEMKTGEGRSDSIKTAQLTSGGTFLTSQSAAGNSIL